MVLKSALYCDKCEKKIGEFKDHNEAYDYNMIKLFDHSEPSGAGDSEKYYTRVSLCLKCMAEVINKYTKVEQLREFMNNKDIKIV